MSGEIGEEHSKNEFLRASLDLLGLWIDRTLIRYYSLEKITPMFNETLILFLTASNYYFCKLCHYLPIFHLSQVVVSDYLLFALLPVSITLHSVQAKQPPTWGFPGATVFAS